VAAAANLKFVLADIASKYRQQTGRSVQFNYGASVQLARQIQQGLPVELFISADEAQVDWLQGQGLTRDAGQRYAIGRLALISLQTHPLAQAVSPEAALRALAPADKLALANPQLAPYGLAAQQALQKTGLWPALHKQLVLGENIGQATQFVLTGAAPLGFTAHALTLAPEPAGRLKVWPVPAELHAPLNQRMVLLKGASPQAQAFRDHLLGPQARALFVQHGYALPQ
jgi:molybdate transport system substrate-binding protein